MTERAQNADFRRKPQIFADSPLLLEIQAFGGRRKLQETADFHRKPKKTAGNRKLGSVTLGPSPLARYIEGWGKGGGIILAYGSDNGPFFIQVPGQIRGPLKKKEEKKKEKTTIAEQKEERRRRRRKKKIWPFSPSFSFFVIFSYFSFFSSSRVFFLVLLIQKPNS